MHNQLSQMKFIVNLKKFRRLLKWTLKAFPSKQELGAYGKNSVLEQPVFIENPQNIFLAENARIRNYCTIINGPTEKVIIKKYSVIAAGTTIITNGHHSTVGIPQFLLGASHINDKSKDVIIEEDVWIGANVTIMAGVTIGRGAIVGAGSIVTKDIPPYALVVGSPAKIVAKKFLLEDVFKHEAELYPLSERLSETYLNELFKNKYNDLKVFGCNNELSLEERKRLNFIKHHLNFIDWKNETNY